MNEQPNAIDLQDVDEMVHRGLVEPARLWELFGAIETQLYRYPAVDGPSFRQAVKSVVPQSET